MMTYDKFIGRGYLAMLLALLLFSLLAISTVLAEERRTDPKELVSYVMPSGWSAERIGNGRHYQRADSPEEKSILAVIPEIKDEYVTLEKIRTGRTQVHAVQDHKQVFSTVKEVNDFEVWEARYEATIRGEDVIMHDFMMFSESRFVEVHLIAAVDAYEAYLPDLHKVVDSLKAIND